MLSKECSYNYRSILVWRRVYTRVHVGQRIIYVQMYLTWKLWGEAVEVHLGMLYSSIWQSHEEKVSVTFNLKMKSNRGNILITVKVLPIGTTNQLLLRYSSKKRQIWNNTHVAVGQLCFASEHIHCGLWPTVMQNQWNILLFSVRWICLSSHSDVSKIRD